MNKSILRSQMKLKRASLSLNRKKRGADHLFNCLFKKLQKFQHILSFASLNDEICLNDLNQHLSKMNQLYLPKINGSVLNIYKINNLSKDLQPSRFGLKEPNPDSCQQVPLHTIDCILIPALAFDLQKNRLGYGMGFYDKLLHNAKMHSIGVGFKEQLIELIPTEIHDQKMNEILLF